MKMHKEFGMGIMNPIDYDTKGKYFMFGFSFCCSNCGGNFTPINHDKGVRTLLTLLVVLQTYL